MGKIKCGVLASDGDGSLSSSAAVSDMTPPSFDHNDIYDASEVSASSEQFDITSSFDESYVHDHFKVGENSSSTAASTPCSSEKSSATVCGRGRARTRGCTRGVRIRGGMRGMRGIHGVRTCGAGIGPRTRGGVCGGSNEFGSCSTFEEVPSDAIDFAAVKLTVSNAVTDTDVVIKNTTVPDEDEGWSSNPPTVPVFPFNEMEGIKVEVPLEEDPSFFMKLFLTDDLLLQMAIKTNQYAQNVMDVSRPLRRKSTLHEWEQVTLEEIQKFIGIILEMGLVGMPSYKHYWSRDRLYKMDFLILRFWHFGDLPQSPNDRLAKVRQLTDYFNDITSEVFTPGKNLSLDESMVLWRGRLIFRQYIKNKKCKYGI